MDVPRRGGRPAALGRHVRRSPATGVTARNTHRGSHILTPAIERRAVDLPPALVISIQLVMGAVLGVLGLMFATPLLACGVVLVPRRGRTTADSTRALAR